MSTPVHTLINWHILDAYSSVLICTCANSQRYVKHIQKENPLQFLFCFHIRLPLSIYSVVFVRLLQAIIPADYIAEITIRPWDPSDPRNKHAIGQMKAHPIHQDECGKTHFRRMASLVQVGGFNNFVPVYVIV